MNLSMAMVLFSCIILITASTQHFSRKTLQAPWTSCNRYNGFTSILTCERFCRFVFDSLYLFSHGVIEGTCYCCDKKPGDSDEYFPDDVRESYIPGFCPFNYTGYTYNEHMICLRYEESMKKYHQAADVCQHEGGDLIRLDSLTKHNIMRSFVEEERTLAEVEVWVQGIRDANLTWRYHDSTQLNYTCLRGVTGEPTDNYMRARSAGSYNCNDHNENYRSFFLCEIYIRDSWF
ncbi:uncharacterized protein LOC128170441 [Crassostrea angulata]|uniref:uncharacterized protein LOC128170441 n=1 Tax=Magallana angulata TaxID=2784310 RepID=UPI0022B10F68|nr:uncharacterized protein LOC128170441 [Crassostrea angulata]